MLDIGFKFGVFHLRHLVSEFVRAHKPTGNPWSVLALASRHDLPLIAQGTLVDFGGTHLWDQAGDYIKPEDMKGLDGVYATALVRALRQNTPSDSGIVCNIATGEQTWCRGVNWAGVSKDFNLEKW